MPMNPPDVMGRCGVHKDYELRILLEMRDEAEVLKRELSRKLLKAREATQDARRAYNSRKRIARLFTSTKSVGEKKKCQALLEKLPSENILLTSLTLAVTEESVVQAAYDKALAAYEDARDKAIEQKKFLAWVQQHYGRILAKELLPHYGQMELVCRYDEELERLDVYFGGRDSPLGAKHAHWIFDHTGLAFRRDPGKR